MDITFSIPDITPLFISYIGVFIAGGLIGFVVGWLKAIWPR